MRWAVVLAPAGSLTVGTPADVWRSDLGTSSRPVVRFWRDSVPALDTGDFASGPRLSGRDTTPTACIGAALVAQRLVQGSRSTQILKASGFTRPQQDTLPVAVVTTARTCGAHLTLATTAPAALPDLFRLALWELNDTLAQAVLTQLVVQEATPAEQGKRLLWGIKEYLAAVPARVTLAEQVAAQVDALGASAWQQRVAAHQTLVDFARQSADWPLVRRQGTLSLAVAREQLAKGLDVLGKTYQTLIQVAWLEHPDSVNALVTQLRADLSQPAAQQATTTWCQGEAAQNRALCMSLHTFNTKGTAWLPLPITDTTSLAILTTNMLGIQMHAPQALPPLRADFWFPPPGSGAGGRPVDSLHPAPAGRVSLIYHMQSDGVGIANCFNGCPADLTGQLLALTQRYGTQVAVTVVVDAKGYTVLHDVATPAQVAESYRWYFQDYLHAPVAVAVRTLPVERRAPAPDGRITYAGRLPKDHDIYAQSHTVLVTNRRGEVVYEGGNDLRIHVAQVVEHEVAAR